MSPKRFFFAPESGRGISNLTAVGAHTTVAPNKPNDPDSRDVFVGISMDFSSADAGEAWAAIDANELRDAIDKAVGKREKDELYLEQSAIYRRVAVHPAFDDCWTPDSTPSASAMIEKLDRLVEAGREGEVDWRDSDHVEIDWPDGISGTEGRIVIRREPAGKYVGQWVFPSGFHYRDAAVVNLNPKAVSAPTPKPYRPVDRDRLLLHIEDIEAALTRRNEQHGRDQERIRELEAEVSELRESLLLNTGAKTAREYLQLAWEAAAVPDGGMIRNGEEMLTRRPNGQMHMSTAGSDICTGIDRAERRLLDPRPEKSEEERAAESLHEDIGNVGFGGVNMGELAARLAAAGYRKGS